MITYSPGDVRSDWDYLYYQGRCLRIEWYYTSDGRMPGLEYYLTLPEKDQERLDYMVKYLADNAPAARLPKSLFRLEDPRNRIFAFKPRAERFFNFFAQERRIIIINAFKKHSRKMTKDDIEKLRLAARLREDYLRRVSERSYYEAKA